MIPVDRLRWVLPVGYDRPVTSWVANTFMPKDVTCTNCHTAIYKPRPEQVWCPVCEEAAQDDWRTTRS